MSENGSCFVGERGTLQNASERRQKCVKKGQKCAEHLWGRTPLDDIYTYIYSYYLVQVWGFRELLSGQSWFCLNTVCQKNIIDIGFQHIF